MEAAMNARTVVHFTESREFGGAERMLLTLLGGMDQQRWRPVLMHHEAPGLDQLLVEANRLGVVTRTVPRISRRRDALRLPAVVRMLRHVRPSVFHVHLSWPLRCSRAILAARAARIPVVIATQHLFSGIQSRRARIRQQLVSLAVDRYIAVSERMGEELSGYAGLKSRVEVIQNGIALAPFDETRAAAAPEMSLRHATGRRVVLAIARLVRRKGIHHLLEAATHLPDVELLIAGEGPERGDLERHAVALAVADRVRFLGHRTDIPGLLAAADVFVLPSLVEGLPICVLEAMAAGKPIVATAIGGTREAVIDGESALLVPAGRADALAGAIRSVLDDPDLAQRLAAAAARRVREQFAAEHMAARTMRLYDRVLAGRGGIAHE
jgi:glycosyltransferase involved in cell wall biosynthesis